MKSNKTVVRRLYIKYSFHDGDYTTDRARFLLTDVLPLWRKSLPHNVRMSYVHNIISDAYYSSSHNRCTILFYNDVPWIIFYVNKENVLKIFNQNEVKWLYLSMPHVFSWLLPEGAKYSHSSYFFFLQFLQILGGINTNTVYNTFDTLKLHQLPTYCQV